MRSIRDGGPERQRRDEARSAEQSLSLRQSARAEPPRPLSGYRPNSSLSVRDAEH